MRDCVYYVREAHLHSKGVGTPEIWVQTGQSHKALILELEDYRECGKVRTRVITCPGVLGAVPVYAHFPSASSFSPRSVLICMLNYMVAHLDTVFEALPLTCIVTSDKLLYLFELHMPHLTHKIVVKIQ